MKTISTIILFAGSGSRMNNEINKVYLPLLNKRVINHSLDKFIKIKRINKIFLVYNPKDIDLINKVLVDYQDYDFTLVEGGKTRNQSVTNALKLIDTDYVLIHDGARPYTSIDDINSLIDSLNENDAVTLYHDCVDAIKFKGVSLNKNELKAVTTPQGFNKKAYTFLINNQSDSAFDELEILESKNFKIDYVKETKDNKKITYQSDLEELDYKVGYSMDFHPFIEKDFLLLGGVKIPSAFGLQGHSDADCLYHAVSEAIFGALHLGDLGRNFPDTDLKYKDYDSSLFLLDAKNKLKKLSYQVVNIDAMIYLEKPKLKNYIYLMEENISRILEISSNDVSIKATTFEKKGPIGSSEGIACETYVLIKKIYN